MPTSTYTPLANLTLSASASSVTFSSISQAYRDLVLVVTGTSTAGDTLAVRLNNDTNASNYFWVYMMGNGASAASGTNSGFNYWQLQNNSQFDSTNRGQAVINIMDYSATDKHKTGLSRSDFPAYSTEAFASRYASTTAISTIRVFLIGGSSFAAGSTFALYGVIA